MYHSLTIFKWKAYLAGQNKVSWERFRIESGLCFTEFQDGKLAEIVIMYGLGTVHSWDQSVSAWASTAYDKCFKVDIVVRRNGYCADLQIKFNNFISLQESLPSGVILVELYPDPSYTRQSSTDEREFGNESLTRVLVKSGFFNSDDIYSLMDCHKKDVAEIDKAWASIGK